MLGRIGKFLKKVKSRKGYTLVEAATVVAITGAMAIVAVPIASDKIEDGKIATAGGSTQAIATAMVKFFGDTANFPIASEAADSVANGVIVTKIKVLRSGLTGSGAVEDTNNLDPDLDTAIVAVTPVASTTVDGSLANANLQLWAPTGIGSVTFNANNASPGITSDTRQAKANAQSNLNNHLVTDAVNGGVGYGKGGLNWLGPYIPSVDQDPWGRNYLAYVGAVDFDSFGLPTGVSNTNINVPVKTPHPTTASNRIYCWIISGGPDEKLQTAPTDSIIQNDDIGTILALPAKVKGTNDKGQGSR